MDTLCSSDGPYTLSPGTPDGGTYAGPGVNGNLLDPASAGIGTHTITYSFNDGSCTGFAQDVITVDACLGSRPSPDRSTFSVSPNPVHDVLLIACENAPIIALERYDATGRRVRSAVVNARQFSMDRSGLQAGTYFLIVRFADGSVTRKVALD